MLDDAHLEAFVFQSCFKDLKSSEKLAFCQWPQHAEQCLQMQRDGPLEMYLNARVEMCILKWIFVYISPGGTLH